MRAARQAAALVMALAGAAAAAPDSSPRPVPRPPPAAEVARAAATPAPGPLIAAQALAARLPVSPRPPARPGTLAQRIEAGFFGRGRGRPSYSIDGSVCGVAAIRGAAIDPIGSGACHVEAPVKITAVAGVELSTAAIMDCTTARTLHDWVEDAVIPTVGRTGGGLLGLKVAAHYACRTRNNQRGARVSEHGKGRAIDISAFYLEKDTITVLSDWGRGKYGRILEKLRDSACGPFGTVLGPGSDGHHRDHFHFDTARYRSGSYCR